MQRQIAVLSWVIVLTCALACGGAQNEPPVAGKTIQSVGGDDVADAPENQAEAPVSPPASDDAADTEEEPEEETPFVGGHAIEPDELDEGDDEHDGPSSPAPDEGRDDESEED